MKSVFLLWHSHEVGPGATDDKLIGVYSTHAEAEEAKVRTMQREGFKDAPEGFEIVQYELNKDEWSDGYISWSEARKSDPK
jgi:hypothetical protein